MRMLFVVLAYLTGVSCGSTEKSTSHKTSRFSSKQFRLQRRVRSLISNKRLASLLLAFKGPAHGSGTRRTLLQSAAALSTGLVALPAVAVESIDPSFVSGLQSPVQDVIAPGHWIGQFIGINSKTDRWEFTSNSAAEVSAALTAVLDQLTPDRRSKLLIPSFKISQADPSRVHVLTWTKSEWLDTFDVSFAPSAENARGCVATASFYATGLLPTSIPLAPLFNIFFAWFPFGSPGPRGEMLQDFRLRAIKGLLDKELAARRG